MDKIIILVDCQGNRREFCIPTFENVFVICVNLISGDEIAQVFYNDGSYVILDSDIHHTRRMSLYDVTRILKPEDLDWFNGLEGSSYVRMFH